jgi:methylmalonyl-CoA mutase cobalamin-binding subunit
MEERDLPVASPEHLAMMKALSMKNNPHRALYEGEDVRVLLNVPGVDRHAVREYFRRQGLLELFDAIDKAR